MIEKVIIEYNNGKIKTLKEGKHYSSHIDALVLSETYYYVTIRGDAEKYINRDTIDAITFIIENEEPRRITKPHINYGRAKNSHTSIGRYPGPRLILDTEWEGIPSRVLTRMGFNYRSSKIVEGQGVDLLLDLKHFHASSDGTTINEIRLITSEFGIVEWKFEDLDYIDYDDETGILQCTGLYSKGKVLYPPGIDNWEIILDEQLCVDIYIEERVKK